MDKHFSSEGSVQRKSRRDEARPMCSVPPHQQLTDAPLLLREYAEYDEEDEGNSMTRPDTFISLDAESDVAARRRKAALVRSKTLDPSLLLQVQSDSELKCERRKPQSHQFLRTNSQYHKVFKDIRDDEELRQSYTCALQKDILYQGRLFVSQNWICFHSKVFGRDTKIAIPVTSATDIKKTKTAILVPNALVISTAHERVKIPSRLCECADESEVCSSNRSRAVFQHVFVSFLSRDTTYKVLMSVCPHLVKSPIPAQNLRRHPVTDFSADLSDLDAPVRRTHHHTDDSSASDSPEFDKSPQFPKHSQTSKRKDDLDSQPQPSDGHLRCKGSAEVTKTPRALSFSFNTLVSVCLCLVCVLLLSSCYMAFKIVSLEERLTSLVSTDFPHEGGEYVGHAEEIYSVISASLLKLEKIHRNLQKLLETLSDA
ncbi:GRAM domain-containing protein 2B isoform X2 [Triplophysa rosa]|uniref:GRAM domain-containing protein 2B isoform X2 n=1 Tax=Triplophysa rosa TaxID=992332 RepID=UPI002545DD92|nr:GRAM domain-containing protein 2B isoform X2 [Triplophysa rosa]